MALTLVHDCPHCYTERAGFTLCGSKAVHTDSIKSRYDGQFIKYQRVNWALLFTCNACNDPVSVKVVSYMKEPSDPMKQDGDIKRIAEFSDIEIFPKAANVDAPEYLPTHIAEAFSEAEDSVRRKKRNSAAMSDRRALELMTRDKLGEEHMSKSLYQRIEMLAGSHEITPDLKEWAHSLRTVGNDGAHSLDGASMEEAEQTHELTRYILTYIYTLPEQIRLAKEKRDAAKQK